MAEINTGGGHGGGKKGQPKKMNLRVDFTPMVDMNMLLLTFFMFCTSLAKPEIMELALPVKDDQVLQDDKKNLTKESKTITLILGGGDTVYYYVGKVNAEKYANWNSLEVTSYENEGGLRDILLKRNREAVDKMIDLKRKKLSKEISEETFKEEATKIKDDPDGQVVVIKPTDDSNYRNMIEVLDEMQICSIGKYAMIEMSEADHFLLQNYKTKGAYGSKRETPK
jgi:biopolymer transport protein ExbD